MRLFVLSVMLLLLTGCAHEPIIIYRTKVVAASDTQLRDCPVQTPPEKEAYLKATVEEREKMLTQNIQSHIKNIALCNSRIGEVRSWNKQQKDLYEGESKQLLSGN